jgi:hypothetical protein
MKASRILLRAVARAAQSAPALRASESSLSPIAFAKSFVYARSLAVLTTVAIQPPGPGTRTNTTTTTSTTSPSSETTIPKRLLLNDNTHHTHTHTHTHTVSLMVGLCSAMLLVEGKTPLYGTPRIPYVMHPCGVQATFGIADTQHEQNLSHHSKASILVHRFEPATTSE